MTHQIPDLPAAVTIGEPLDSHGLRVFPLYPTQPPQLRLLTLGEGLQRKLVTLSETPPDQAEGDQAWFRGLWLANRSTQPVLLTDRDLVRGGRQDRIIDKAMIVAAGSSQAIPVSCVELERSHYRDRHYPDQREGTQGGWKLASTSADPALRRARMGHPSQQRPDQSQTWAGVAARRRAARLPRAGGSLAEVPPRALGTALLQAFPAPYGATGLVVARHSAHSSHSAHSAHSSQSAPGPRLVLVEWCCDPSALGASWGRIIASLSGCTGSGAHSSSRQPRISRTEVRQWLERLAQHARPLHTDVEERYQLQAGTLSGWGLQWQGQAAYVGVVG